MKEDKSDIGLVFMLFFKKYAKSYKKSKYLIDNRKYITYN